MKNCKSLGYVILCTILILAAFAGCGQRVHTETATTEPTVEGFREYSISYEVNGGVLSETAPTTYSENKPVVLKAPSKDNCVFAGWYEEKDFSGDAVLTTEGASGDKVYHAMWMEIKETDRVGEDYAENLPETSDVAETAGHDYEAIVIAPTTDEDGYTLHICRVCGDSYKDNYTKRLPAETKAADSEHVHAYTSVITKPSCTKKGYTTHTCACGDSFISHETVATGHCYESRVIAATTSEQGYTLHTCQNCDASYTDSYTEKLPGETEPDPTETEETTHVHSYTSTVTNPTCTENGFTTHICACGDSYTSDETAATGSHDYESEVVPPTPSRRGYTLHTCKGCGDSYRDTYVDRLPESEPADPYDPPVIQDHIHAWGDWIRHEDGWKYRICSGCGNMDIEW